MFYKMIEKKCNEWYKSDLCTVKNLIEYIEKTGQMRDAQIEGIKIYLFLKIACGCQPLETLFVNGKFNSINLDDIELSTNIRDYLKNNPAAAANKLGRRFIHCDIGLNSIQTTRDRLKADGAEFDVLEIKDGVQLYRNPVQTMDKIKSLIPGLKNEDSLDSFWEGVITDSKLGTIPVYVPNLMDSSTKLLDKVLMNRIIHQAIPDLDSDIKKVIVYYVDITSEEEINKFIAEDDSTTVEIELRDLKTVLDDVVIEDYAEFHVDEVHEDLFGGYAVCIDNFASDRVQGKIAEFNDKNRLNTKKEFTPITISEEGLELIEFLSVDCTAPEGEWHSDSEIKIDKKGYVIINGEKVKDFWDGRILCKEKPLRLKIRNICGDETVWDV